MNGKHSDPDRVPIDRGGDIPGSIAQLGTDFDLLPSKYPGLQNGIGGPSFQYTSSGAHLPIGRELG
ncbi:hypothetical protein VJ786_02365 [Sphingobacterium sp. PU5-4]|uniref:Uncharacterized protein n=1 Tax=Sphingobacterium tenebrionis TaxID=3111775 RepID=A0ABU8I1Z1_9SPHI